MSSARVTESTNPSRGAATLRVAVLGATGLVGEEMIRLLGEREFPAAELLPLASDRVVGRSVTFGGAAIGVLPARPELLSGADIVLASAGGSVSRDLLPRAAADGAICIDNTSAFRMDPDVPLVVPEVNGHRLDGIRPGQGGAIVANPNCSTIQLVVALAPLHALAGVRRVVVSTYQSMSGAGRRQTQRFRDASRAILDGRDEPAGTAAFDAIPDIGGLGVDGDTIEEVKMIRETPKILESDIGVDVCCVRVPVFRGHAESVLVETDRPVTLAAARAALAAAPGVTVVDEPGYPTPRAVAGRHAVHVGRIRRSRTVPHGIQLWVVADNLLKGAALNAVQVAERIVRGPAPPSAATTEDV